MPLSAQRFQDNTRLVDCVDAGYRMHWGEPDKRRSSAPTGPGGSLLPNHNGRRHLGSDHIGAAHPHRNRCRLARPAGLLADAESADGATFEMPMTAVGVSRVVACTVAPRRYGATRPGAAQRRCRRAGPAPRASPVGRPTAARLVPARKSSRQDPCSAERRPGRHHRGHTPGPAAQDGMPDAGRRSVVRGRWPATSGQVRRYGDRGTTATSSSARRRPIGTTNAG